MAAPRSNFKPNGKTHRDLIQAAEHYFADLVIRQYPALTYSRALAKGLRKLASEMGVDRSWVVHMRQSSHVPKRHWETIERVTQGVVKVKDFERARCRNNGPGKT